MKILFAIFLTLQIAHAIATFNTDSTNLTDYANWNEIRKQAFVRLASPGYGGFVPPVRKQVEELKKKVDELQNQIKLLSESSSANKTILKNKISVLEDEIKALREQLANSESASTETLYEIAQQISELKEEIKRLTIRYLPDDCVRDIQEKRFADAEKKLTIIADVDEIVDIFDRVYTRREENIPLLDDFAKSLNNKDVAILIYKYLANEVKSHRDSDVMKVVHLYESLNTMFPSPIANASTRDTVETVSRKFMKVLKDMTELKFTNDIFNSDQCKGHATSDVNYALRSIIKFNHDMFVDLIDKVVLEIYGEKLDDIFECISGNEFVELRIVASSAIFFKLKKKSQLDKPAVFKLAACIKGTMDNGNYANVSPDVKVDFEKVKAGLPTVVLNIVFSSKVCVKSLRHSEYLYATEHLRNNETRFVYTWMEDEGMRFDQAYWNFEMQNDYSFRIKSNKFNEYMKLEENAGSVYTWVPKTPLEDIWDFTVVSDTGVFIHNIRYRFNLFTHFVGADGRRVVTLLTENVIIPDILILNKDDLIWEIEDCSKQRVNILLSGG